MKLELFYGILLAVIGTVSLLILICSPILERVIDSGSSIKFGIAIGTPLILIFTLGYLTWSSVTIVKNPNQEQISIITKTAEVSAKINLEKVTSAQKQLYYVEKGIVKKQPDVIIIHKLMGGGALIEHIHYILKDNCPEEQKLYELMYQETSKD